MVAKYKVISPIVPPTPFARGDPPPNHAELTVYALGPDQDAIIPVLRILGELSLRELQRFQQALPVVMTLPATFYDHGNAFVTQLRKTGTRFKITSESWVCPKEMADDHHWCNQHCSTFKIREEITDDPRTSR